MPDTILAIDTATGPCSVAVLREGRVAAYVETLKATSQSASLLPMIEKALREAGAGYDDLTAIACTVGPGSFTGLRVGLAAARGICFATGLPGLGFTTLEVLAFAASDGKSPVLASLNAGKGEYYYQAFAANGAALFTPRVGTSDRLLADTPPHAVLSGDKSDIPFPRADALALLANVFPAQVQPLTPYYIREPDAKLPVKKI